MKSSLVRWTLISMSVISTGCAGLSHGPKISPGREGAVSQARKWMIATRRDGDPCRATRKILPALRLALADDSTMGCDIARSALSRYTQINFREGHLKNTNIVGCDGISYRVRLIAARNDWSPQLFDQLEFIRPVTTTANTPLRWNGWGVAVVGVSNPDRKKEPFAPRHGYRLPVTIVADTRLHGEICDIEIRFLNPEKIKSTQIGGVQRSVAGDLDAANRATFRTGNPLLIGLKWLFVVDRFSYPTRLVFTQPYDRHKIPVVFVHGLLSTQAIWGGVIRELSSDPSILRHYQFWFFHYPTGQPIPVSALQLRSDLQMAEQHYRPQHGIVLIGHSMGGIISRAQASSSGGNAILNQIFGRQAPEVIARLPGSPLLRDALIFERDKNVRRLVFICVPHRGSSIATAGPIGFVVALIRLPSNISAHFLEMRDLFRAINLHRPPTSICGLSPRSPFLDALNRRPIEAPHHSILGDRGRGDSPNSSDGVVRYESAHLETAESELIVPAGHGAHAHPSAILEMKRILLKHLDASEN
ncbi:MAG: alpha/beta hydrolase [bacterium]